MTDLSKTKELQHIMKKLIRQLFRQKYYRDIIFMLELFQSHHTGNGLSQKHFRYVLMKEHGLDKPSAIEMKQFYENNKNMFRLFEQGGSRKGSVATQRDLNYYLKYLYKNNIIKKVNRKKPFQYILTSEFYKSVEEIKKKLEEELTIICLDKE